MSGHEKQHERQNDSENARQVRSRAVVECVAPGVKLWPAQDINAPLAQETRDKLSFARQNVWLQNVNAFLFEVVVRDPVRLCVVQGLCPMPFEPEIGRFRDMERTQGITIRNDTLQLNNEWFALESTYR